MVQAGSTARVVQAVRDDWPRTGVLADLGGGRPVHLRRRADAGALRLKNRRLPAKRGGRLPPCGQHAAHLVADGRAAVRHTIGSPHHAFRSRTPGDASTISAWASVRWRAVAYVWVTVLGGGWGVANMATVVDTALVLAQITRAGVHVEVRMQKAEPPWSFGIMNPFGAAVGISSHMHGQAVKDRGTHQGGRGRI